MRQAPVGGGFGDGVSTHGPVAVAGPAGVAVSFDGFADQAGVDEAGQVEPHGVGVHVERAGQFGDPDRCGGPHRLPYPAAGRFGQHPGP